MNHALNVCPADTVYAPVERVWGLLTNPAEYGRFWDFTVDRLDPEGRAAAGQKFAASTREFGMRWRIEGEIELVDPQRRHIAFRTRLPFGVVGHNRMVCSPVDERRCLVRFD